jgi:hypothetical protein
VIGSVALTSSPERRRVLQRALSRKKNLLKAEDLRAEIDTKKIRREFIDEMVDEGVVMYLDPGRWRVVRVPSFLQDDDQRQKGLDSFTKASGQD